MPVMEPTWMPATLKAWARTIDDGPFSSLCWGERIAFDNPEAITLLGALAAWTDRVRLGDDGDGAAAARPGDAGEGAGDRRHAQRRPAHRRPWCRRPPARITDAVGADPATQTMRGMADRVAVMKRVWAGEKVTDSVIPVGPPPLQRPGPPLLVGTMGPKTVRSAAASWADGLAGTTLDLDVAEQNELFDVARSAWAQAGKPKPASGDVVLVRTRRRRRQRARRSTGICAAT